MKNFIILLLILTGCQKSPCPRDQNKQVIRVNIHTEPPTLDARKATDTSSISVVGLCFEGLTRRVKGGPPELALAERVEISEDLKTYTFYLRPSNWWDGEPVTAYDFETTWKTVLDPKFLSGFASDLYVIENAEEAKNGRVSIDQIGVKALNDSVLEVKLKHPVPYFLDLTAANYFLAVPRHITNRNPNWANNSGTNFVGNGPFRLVKWHHHHQMVFQKNESYWDKARVNLEEIHLSIIPDETTELNMYEAGELDWAGSPLSQLPPDAIYALKEQERLSLYPISGTYYFVFNVEEPPFNNLNFRKALSYAIDRQSIIDNIVQGHQQPALSLVPPTIWPDNKPYFKDADLEKAHELFEVALKEMGFTAKTIPPITLSYNTMDAHHRIAQALQEQWQKTFGIRVVLKNKEWKVFLDELTKRQFQIARLGGVAGYNDPLTFLDPYRYDRSLGNYSGWNNPVYKKLLSEADVATDLAKREELLRKAEQILMEEMPITPIYFYTGTYTKKPYVKEVQLNDLSEMNFKFAFLEM